MMTKAESIAMVLALVLISAVVFTPSLSNRASAILTGLGVLTIALVVFYQWSR
jgi:inner membrane protein involved in colicin E2 resistance